MKRKARDARRVKPEEARADDVMSLSVRDSWVATRYALPRFHLAQMRPPVRSLLLVTTGRAFYRMDVLSDDKRREFFALLAEQRAEFEVWR